MRSTLPLIAGVCFAAYALSTSALLAGPSPGKQPLSPKQPVTIAPPPQPHGFFVRAGGGVEFPIGHEFHGGASFCDQFGQFQNVNVGIQSNDWDDIYDEMYGGSIEIGKNLSERLAAYLGVGYVTGDANNVGIGTIAGFPAFAKFDDYEAWRVYGGIRHDLTKGNRLTPYVGAHAGVAFSDEINGTFRVPRAGATVSNVPFYEESTSFFGGFTLGLSYAVKPNFDIGVESGVNYTSSLDEDDSGLRRLGLAGLNNGEGLWTIPVRLFAEIRF